MHSQGGRSADPLLNWTGQNLHLYGLELFCISMNYVQFRVIRVAPTESEGGNSEVCALEND